jgi:prefoldin subunit 5
MEQQINEQQLIQMAQKEEAIMNSQNNFLQNLKNALKEAHETIESLKEIQKKPGKIFFKIGPGVMIEGEIKNTEKCKRAFSENGFKEEKIVETIKWMEKRKGNLEQQAQKVQTDLIQTEQKLTQIINLIKQIQQEKSKNISVK